MENKCIRNTTEASSEEILNNCTELNVSHATVNTHFTEKAFDAILYNIKVENDSLFHDESSDLEDSASIAYKSIGNKNKKQDEMCELISTSYEKDVNVSESNSQELADTKLVDGTILSAHTSSSSTALPIIKISPKSGLHNHLKYCFKCNKVFSVLKSPVHICQIQSIDKQNEFLKTVEPPNMIANPVSIKRKQSNVTCDTIYNKDVKIQRLNQKYSYYENNSTDDNTTKFYRNKNIAHASPLQFTRKLVKIPHFWNKEKSCVKNVLFDKDISDSDSVSDSENEDVVPEIKETDFIVVASDDDLSLDSNYQPVNSELLKMDCKLVSDTEKSLDDKIILNGENISENLTTLLDNVKDSNCKTMPDAGNKSDSDKQSHKNISVTEEEFNNKNISTLKIVSNVQKGSDREILLDGDSIFETASWSEKGIIKYKIISDDEGNKGKTCIILSDNDEEFNNKVFPTYKINVQKGLYSKIVLDGKNIKIVSLSENKMNSYEVKHAGKENSKCIIIYDNEKEFINKKIYTFKIVSNIEKGSDCEMLVDCKKVYEIESDSANGKINYIITTKDEVKSSGNTGCIIIPNNKMEVNNKISKFNILVRNIVPDNEESCFNKVSDIIITSNGTIKVDNSQGLKMLADNNTINNDLQVKIKYGNKFPCIMELTMDENDNAKQDKTEEYFKNYYSALRYYIKSTENQPIKNLYSLIGNDSEMLLYLLENYRMFYYGELRISETADEFSKNFLKEQKATLYNYFGDPKDNINASKPFIHPSSHLHQYSKRLSSNIEPLTFKDITTTPSTNSIASPKNNFSAKNGVGSKFNNIRTSKLLPLCNSVSKSRPSYLSNNNQIFTPLILNHQAKSNIQYPVAIIRKRINKG